MKTYEETYRNVLKKKEALLLKRRKNKNRLLLTAAAVILISVVTVGSVLIANRANQSAEASGSDTDPYTIATE